MRSLSGSVQTVSYLSRSEKESQASLRECHRPNPLQATNGELVTQPAPSKLKVQLRLTDQARHMAPDKQWVDVRDTRIEVSLLQLEHSNLSTQAAHSNLGSSENASPCAGHDRLHQNV